LAWVQAPVDAGLGGWQDAVLAWALLSEAVDVPAAGHSDEKARGPEKV
jgi:hypothetical protein